MRVLKVIAWILAGVGILVYTMYLPAIEPRILELPSAGQSAFGFGFTMAGFACILHGLIGETGPKKC